MLEIRNIQKQFGSQTAGEAALRSVDLRVEKGEFFSLLGPSGCGKSTLLRILAGLESASAGEILWDGKRIDRLPARERPFNMVFQKYALFPHLSVEENVAFGLKIKRVPPAEITSRVKEALDLVNLVSFAKRLPETLSGGQAQRVALARALVNRPACLLLDEPLTALDQKLREHMQTELRILQRRLGLTFIFVTHDQEEAMILSDRIAVMNNGRVEQVSTPKDLYEAPQSLFCARFIGRRNELPVRVVESGADWTKLDYDGRAVLKTRTRPQISGGGAMQAFIRPERVRVFGSGLSSACATNGFNLLGEAEVIQVLFRGVRTEVVVALCGSDAGALGGPVVLRSLIDLESGNRLHIGDRVGVEFAPEETHVFPAAIVAATDVEQ